MIAAGIIILCFTFIQLMVALANLLFYQSYQNYNYQEDELVSVLIPARNEEINLPKLLTDLQNQAYQNIEAIVFDDQSTDNTSGIVKEYAATWNKIRYLTSNVLPDGWLGKNYACHSLSEQAKGKYYLFLDADVRIKENLIAESLGYIRYYKPGLMSVFPKQIMKSFGEKITVPNMNYILLSLLPLILVRKTKTPSVTAANGQFMFFRAECYRKIKPHFALRTSKVEDIEISRLFKRRGVKVACLTGSENITCRMYPGFREAVHGFSKNVVMFFGNSILLAIVFWLITSLGFVVVYISFQTHIFIGYIIALIMIRIMVSKVSRQPVFQNLVFAPLQQITLGIFIIKAIIIKFSKQYTWKQRNIS